MKKVKRWNFTGKIALKLLATVYDTNGNNQTTETKWCFWKQRVCGRVWRVQSDCETCYDDHSLSCTPTTLWCRLIPAWAIQLLEKCLSTLLSITAPMSCVSTPPLFWSWFTQSEQNPQLNWLVLHIIKYGLPLAANGSSSQQPHPYPWACLWYYVVRARWSKHDWSIITRKIRKKKVELDDQERMNLSPPKWVLQ